MPSSITHADERNSSPLGAPLAASPPPPYARSVNSRDEDEAWRDIVDNFGEAPSGDELDTPVEPEVVELPGPTEYLDPWRPEPWEDEGRFVPPPAPPVPLADPPRLLAWIGVFGAPTVLLIGLIFAIGFPGWLSTLLVASFIGGFGFLVATMSSEPRDPGDDGARV